jgi:hypothetical protein
MPGGITANSRTGSVASRPSAGFRIPSANCWISPGVTMPEPIGSAPSQRQVIGEPPEWALWVVVGLLAFVTLLPTITR